MYIYIYTYIYRTIGHIYIYCPIYILSYIYICIYNDISDHSLSDVTCLYPWHDSFIRVPWLIYMLLQWIARANTITFLTIGWVKQLLYFIYIWRDLFICVTSLIYMQLRKDWFLFERTCVFAGIQFTKHFIEFVLVETNQLFGSNSNVILTRQTCVHRSSRVAGSKRWAQAFYFSVRIWYMVLISKCSEESDLGLCMSLVLAKRMPLHSADFRQILRPNTFLNRKSALRSGILFASTELMHRPRSNSSPHLDIKNTCQIRTEKSNASARRLLPATLIEYWPQVCHVKITFELLPTNSFVST